MKKRKTTDKIAPRRVGRFRLSTKALRAWPDLLPLMGQMVVIHCDYRFDLDAVDYIAFSPLFFVAEEGQEPPWYEVIGNPDGSMLARLPPEPETQGPAPTQNSKQNSK